jgi:hypothetical protein
MEFTYRFDRIRFAATEASPDLPAGFFETYYTFTAQDYIDYGTSLLEMAERFRNTEHAYVNEFMALFRDQPGKTVHVIEARTELTYSGGRAPAQRLHPRDDDYAGGPMRLTPSPSSRQASNRLGGYL